MKKVSEMPWDDPNFVAAMKVAYRVGYSNGEHDGASYYDRTASSRDSFEDFMRDAKEGYED
jgi:hypothetical protein